VNAVLSKEQVRAGRMVSMLLGAPEQRTALEVVRWFGAMQAQDVGSGHWSIGVRCPGSTEADVLASFERGEIVRTWPMRGTIHTVPAADVRWMLELTGTRMHTASQGRRDRLGLTDDDIDRATAALDDALRTDRVLTRAQSLQVIADAGTHIDGQRGYHLLWHAAHAGVICIGPQRGSDQTFVLLDDWAPQQNTLSRDEALAELLVRFVRSHGPVPIKDFSGWTGLTMTDAKAAQQANDGRLVRLATVAGEMLATHEIAEFITHTAPRPQRTVALPGFDEFVLGYKDRSLQIPDGSMEQIVPGGNGVFRATIVADGRAAATWKRTMRKSSMQIEVEPLHGVPQPAHGDVLEAFAPYAAFLGRSSDLRVVTAP
jgi:hypothetical protein